MEKESRKESAKTVGKERRNGYEGRGFLTIDGQICEAVHR